MGSSPVPMSLVITYMGGDATPQPPAPKPTYYYAECALCTRRFQRKVYDDGEDGTDNGETTHAKCPVKGKHPRRPICPRCGDFVVRWPNNTNVYPPRDPIHEQQVAEFADDPVHASWLVWHINSRRKASNSRAVTKTRQYKERQNAEGRSEAVRHRKRRIKLLSFNKVMTLCKELGK